MARPYMLNLLLDAPTLEAGISWLYYAGWYRRLSSIPPLGSADSEVPENMKELYLLTVLRIEHPIAFDDRSQRGTIRKKSKGT
mmetsp:Transcript_28626/g.69350  ORF Transcript_28626/g.69350 Transcript_28626/m.69350 type:complete len:83 (+) Transcript_28626:1534-1782(+)